LKTFLKKRKKENRKKKEKEKALPFSSGVGVCQGSAKQTAQPLDLY